jgi:flagellar biosynthesis chaperone FliJ
VAQKSDLPPYPLKQVLEIKKRRVEAAEKVLKEKQKALEAEKEKLKEREKERDKVLDHYKAKLQQMRDEFDHGTTSTKIDQIKIYIKVVQERLKVEEKKVKDQQQQVEVAEKNVEIAKKDLQARMKEQDKIEMHQKEWEKQTLKEIESDEVRAEDDLGSTMFLSKYMQKRSQEKKMANKKIG